MTTPNRTDPHCAADEPCTDDPRNGCPDRAADHATLACGCERECPTCGRTLVALTGAAVAEAARWTMAAADPRRHRVHGHAFAAFTCPSVDGPACVECLLPRAMHGRLY